MQMQTHVTESSVHPWSERRIEDYRPSAVLSMTSVSSVDALCAGYMDSVGVCCLFTRMLRVVLVDVSCFP